jgi:hypothetical protein
MAGLKELIEFEKIESEPTSTVPTNKEDYTQPYEPSALKGVAGLALAGAGAVALRSPIGRAIQKLSSLKTPKAPVSRITEPVDEVEEILSIVPTKVDRGRAMTQAQIPLQEQIRQEAIAKSNELRKLAYNNPLSRGGKTNRIGSSLWDYIARHPVSGARKPEEWIKDFKSSGPGSFKTGNPEFKQISQAVKKDELWDSNLIQFDKAGNVIGGFLKVAQEKKIPLTKMDLLYIVEKAPVNNLVMRKYNTNIKVVDEAEDFGREVNNALENIRGKILATPTSDGLQNLLLDVNSLQTSVGKVTARMNNKFRVVSSDSYDDFNQSPFGDVIGGYESIVQRARRLGIDIDTNEVSKITELGKRRDTEMFRKLQLQSTQGMMPKYGSYNEYRIKGGDEYFENVVYYPKPLPMGQKLSSEYNRHYSGVPNQIYHIRGSVRAGGEPNQKVMMIDEIQSDYNQKLRNVDPTRAKVVNAFGTEVEFFSANRKLEKIVNDMKAIANKGIRMTNEEAQRFNKLKSDFNELKANSMNLSNITSNKAQDGIPFLPLYGKENWGGHALKNTIKDAASRGDVQWVAISPVERLHHAKRDKYLGDIEFYGTRNGKAGFDNYEVFSKKADRKVKTDPKKDATLPAEMKRLAREYNSEVKVIKVAKSDPKKPFKIVKNVGTNTKFKLDKDSAGTEHEVAFKTRKEAEYYSGRYDGDVQEIPEGDPRLYFDAFAIKISPDMINKPFKAYNEGGLVVNIFA